MKATINGHLRDLPDELTVSALLELLGSPRAGIAVARNAQTRYKTFWAMVIAEKSPKRKDRKAGVGTSENAISTVKHFVCKYLC